MRKTSRNNISKGSAGSFASSACYSAELLIDPAEEMMVMAAFWVQLNPRFAGHVAHEVPQLEDLMLGNGLKRLSVNVPGLLGGHVCQGGHKLNWC